jgi:hypothetical protein
MYLEMFISEHPQQFQEQLWLFMVCVQKWCVSSLRCMWITYHKLWHVNSFHVVKMLKQILYEGLCLEELGKVVVFVVTALDISVCVNVCHACGTSLVLTCFSG